MSDGLFFSAKLVDGKIVFYRGPNPVNGAAYYPDKPELYKYLVLDDSGVHEVNQEQKDIIDAAEAQAIQDRINQENIIKSALEEQQAIQEAAAAEERLNSFIPLIPTARLFRSILRIYFGEGAEINRDITSEVVMGYFLQKRKTGITLEETFDSVSLMKLHQILTYWNRTDETWTLPWHLVTEE